MSFRVTSWIEARGFLGSFGIYAGVISALALLLPLLYFFGKKLRHLTAGTIKNRGAVVELEKRNTET